MLRLLKQRSAVVRNYQSLRSLSSNTQVPESADVVVIGGGIAGCNILYQLSKHGVNAVLLERSKLTAGTTWHTAGLVWSLRPSDVEVELLRNSQEVYKNLESETGVYSGWINNGGLFISHSEIRTNEYQRLATLGNAFGIPSEMLSPEEACKLFPLMDPKAFTAALYSPNDGTIDPAMACAALTKYAKDQGAKVIENCPVQHIEIGLNMLGNREIKSVSTPNGSIKTKCIVNCTGAWSSKITRKAGLPPLPLVAMKHGYIVSDGIEGIRGCPNIRDHDASIYIKVQGDSLHMGGYEPNPIIIEDLPEDFDFQLYELDWNVFGMHVEAAHNLVPVFENTGIKSTVYGPESFTADHKPLLGEDTRVYGLYHNCAYNSAGMMFSAGCAIEMAEWIITGRPTLPMFTFDVRRFSPAQMANSDWLMQRSHEAYAKNYAAVFPHDQPLAGRGVSTDALHEVMVNDGAFMETRQGWERPAYFLPGQTLSIPAYDFYGAYDKPRNTDKKYERALKTDYTYGFSEVHDLIAKEALSCRNHAGLFNMSYYGKFYLTGPDAQKVADLAFTADMSGGVGKVVYTCSLNSKGGVEADITVSIIEGGNGKLHEPIFKGKGFYLVSSGFNSYHTASHIRKIIYQYKLQANLTDVTRNLCILSVQGPDSQRILQKYTNSGLSNDAFSANSHKSIQLYSKWPHKSDTPMVPCRALRVTWSGELGWELHIPSSHARQLYEGIKVAKGLTPCGWRALTALSAEKGYHLWNHDITAGDNPVEANLGFTCRNNGYYIGKEHVDKAKKEGVKKKYAFFTLNEHKPLFGFETVYRNGKVAGHLRRGDYAFYLDKPIGVGYIRNTEDASATVDNNYLKSGDYEIEIMGVRHKATLHTRSPFDPQGKRILGIYEEPKEDEHGHHERVGGCE